MNACPVIMRYKVEKFLRENLALLGGFPGPSAARAPFAGACEAGRSEGVMYVGCGLPSGGLVRASW
jgi:hypothetical protein